MSRHVIAPLICALILSSLPAHAGTLTLDLPTALARARDRAPDAIAARGRIQEAEAARTGARILFTQNPELQVGAGPRYGDPRTTKIVAQVAQQLEPTRRGARIGVADAELRHARSADDAQLRELSFAVTTVFCEARHGDLVVELATRGLALAARAAEVAERRRKAGDITDLDVDLVKIALGRSRSAVAAAQADRADALGRLAVLIGAQPDEVIQLTGDLRPSAVTLEGLRTAVPARADVRALAEQATVARAQRRLATASGRPDLGVWVGYERDEGDTVVLGGLTATLPLWNRAQGDQAVARAREKRVAAERVAVLAAASRQVGDAFEAYTRSREAVEVYEREVIPVLVDSELLLERSMEAGQLAVTTYLGIRQEVLGARREYLDRQLALAKSAALARFIAGVAP